ncbi:MAG: TetR/AcrR family transcriptional regulator [Deltaproteobacteria bacterium]|nr:TetR/AcrR family transcriptional regulator [Deltaproteobacteria bacterium]
MASSPSEGVQEPVTARGQRTRQRILDAAETVFGERGYEAASIVDITRAAGVAQGTFYLYFNSKKAVFAELVGELGATLRRTLAAAIEGHGERLEVERAGFVAFLRFVQEHKNLYRIIRQAEFVDEALYRDYYQRLAQGYRDGLAKAMKRGEIRKLDPEAVAFALMGIFDFLGMRWVLWENRLPPKKTIDDVFTLIRDGLGLGGGADGDAT